VSQFGGTPVDQKSTSKFGGKPVGQSEEEPTTLHKFAAGMPDVSSFLLNKREPVATELAGGALTGAASLIPGMGGDLREALALTPFGAAPIVPGAPGPLADALKSNRSLVSKLPTSEQVGNALAGGPPKTPAAGIGRFLGSAFGLPGALKVGGPVAKAVGQGLSHIVGLAGTGARPIQEAAKAGAKGGTALEALDANMAGKVPMEDVVQSFRDAVGELKAERSAAYQKEMSRINQDIRPLDFNVIDDVLRAHKDAGFNRNGTIPIKPGAAEVREAIGAVVKQFRDNPALRTIQDFDELKQAINDLQYHGALQTIAGPGTFGSTIIRDVRDAIGKEIARIDKTYATVMKDYHAASETIDELNQGLSLGEKKTIDTALRKLQSIMRDNVSTNYGYRGKLMEKVDKSGTLAPALAGQALASWEPRGLGRYLAGAELLSGHAAALPASIPRVVGNVARGAGIASRYVPTPQQAFYASLASQTPQLFQMPDPTDLRTALGTR
jgi:hypothetical protein